MGLDSVFRPRADPDLGLVRQKEGGSCRQGCGHEIGVLG